MNKRIIHHHYQDHANAVPPDQTKSDHTFIYKLHSMLNDVEQQGLSHIVSWQPHGRCFIVHDAKEFERILPSFYALTKIASFQRQLNIYGFCRISKGIDRGAYYHECFLRGMPWLAQKIVRIKVKGTLVRGKSNPEEEPDFWSMSWVSPNGPSKARALSYDQAETTNTTGHRTSLSMISTYSQASLHSDTNVNLNTCDLKASKRTATNQITLENALYRNRDIEDKPFSCLPYDLTDLQLIGDIAPEAPVLEDNIDCALANVNIREVFDDILMHDWMLLDL